MAGLFLEHLAAGVGLARLDNDLLVVGQLDSGDGLLFQQRSDHALQVNGRSPGCGGNSGRSARAEQVNLSGATAYQASQAAVSPAGQFGLGGGVGILPGIQLAKQGAFSKGALAAVEGEAHKGVVGTLADRHLHQLVDGLLKANQILQQ